MRNERHESPGNGGINLSELDGWWAEAYAPEVGWAIGDGLERSPDADGDRAEAELAYNLLEREIVPEFYARDETGIPRAWVARMRESMVRLTPRFSADRSVREYTEQYYLPAVENFLLRAENKGAVGAQIVKWTRRMTDEMATIHLGETKVQTIGAQHIFECSVYLNEAEPQSVRIELYANRDGERALERREMKLIRQLDGVKGGFVFGTLLAATRAAADYTVRLIPHFDGVAIPLEASQILWQR